MKFLLIFLFSLNAHAMIKVAVIDTGFDFDSKWNDAKRYGLAKPKLCKEGHKDFTGTGLRDNYNHGTHVSGLIAKGNENVNYCLVIIKFFDGDSNPSNLQAMVDAVNHAIKLKVSVINISAGGYITSKEECQVMNNALNKGIIIVAAVGNDNKNLNKMGYYPALCDKRIIKVMNLNKYGKKSISSNYGFLQNLIGEIGEEIVSLCPSDKYCIMTGTSQAAAITTSKIIRGRKWK